MGKNIFDSTKLVQHCNENALSRRSFLKNTGVIGCASLASSVYSHPFDVLAVGTSQAEQSIDDNYFLFNGERKDPITGNYHLGNGVRDYNPSIMRFHAMDSVSPFGDGGINGYAYCMGDPVNRRDPSGHFIIIPLLIILIGGAIIGAGIAAAAEGIKAAVTGKEFNIKAVVYGAARGAVSSIFGMLTMGVGAAAFLWLSLAQAAVETAVMYGVNLGMGASHKQAITDAAVGAAIGLATNVTLYAVGRGLQSAMSSNDTKYITLQGNMRNVDSPMEGLYYFEDVYKGAPRLNIVAHGGLRADGTSAMVLTSSTGATVVLEADQVARMTQVLYDVNNYANVRVLSCFSAAGGEKSFAAELSRQLNSPVKAFQGTVTADMEPGKLSRIIMEDKVAGDYGLATLHGEITRKSTAYTVTKVNPYKFYQSEYWKFSYKPKYFVP